VKKKYIIIISFISVLITCCITPFNIDNEDQIKDILVVDGIVTSGTTSIRLMRSVGINDRLTEAHSISNASLYVECSDGSKSGQAKAEDGDGWYYITTGELNTNLQYRLAILLDGKTYYSEFLSPLTTPEVEVSYSKESRGKPVHINVSTQGANSQSGFYLWSFKEIWEYQASIYATHIALNGDTIQLDQTDIKNIFYCWRYASSNSYLLGSTDKLSENTLKDKKIHEINSSDDRLSHLYYINVSQNAISKKAFDYFSNLQKNVDMTGDIFAPIPSEIRGNIYCEEEPDIPVIGYVEVSNTANKELYVPYDWYLYEPETVGCESTSDKEEAKSKGYQLYSYDFDEHTNTVTMSFSNQLCFDCRLKGTKSKPSFWPNDYE